MIATLLKARGYTTGQFGKNHLGDRNEYLPTVHGFDEFYGNLYHLNAEEEPEHPDYPRDPAFRAKYGPRGVMDCLASDVDDPTVDPRFGRVGKQKIKDTGPLTKKRMEKIDDVFLLVPAQDFVGEFLMTFKDYPPRQKAASFNLDEVMQKLQEGGGSK